MSKHALIIKESKVQIHYKTSHLHIVSPFSEQYIGFDKIYGCYINQNIKIDLDVIMKISKKVPLYFIDKKGTIIAKISFQV